MDTSDSEEYYESADEHFDSLEDLRSCVKSAKVEHANKLDESGESGAQKTQYGVPPSRVECWEPGVNNMNPTVESKSKSKHALMKSVSNDNKSDLQSQSTDVCENKAVDNENNLCTGSTEDVEVPAKSVIKIETTNNTRNKVLPADSLTRASKDTKSGRPEYGIPPLIPQCWEPGMHNEHKVIRETMADNESNTELKTPKSKSIKATEVDKGGISDYKTPPLIEECCEPGMQYIPEEVSTKSECYSKLKLDKKSTDDCSFECNIAQGIEKKIGRSERGFMKQTAPNLGETKQSKKTLPELVEKKSTEDNLWDDNEGWGFHDEVEIDSISTTKKTDDAWNVKALAKSETNEAIKNRDPFEENMWNDEDDWNIGNAQSQGKEPVKQEASDDDMWAEDDGWTFNENKMKTNEKPATKTKDDLWGADDIWEHKQARDACTKENTVTSSKENTVTSTSSALGDLSLKTDNSSWGSWGNWGISSVLSTAANITTTVSQGLTTAIGVPDPEQLAREHKAEREKLKDNESGEPEIDNSKASTFGLGNIVSGVSTITKLAQTTSTKVISGGLDTLETIGKKTMEVLQENDPGLKKKYAFLKIDQDKPVLSQMLREAKEKAEEENKERVKQHYKKRANYETIFDDYQGLVHLEALEMLSKQSEIKLHSVMSRCTQESLIEFKETMDQVKELCELPDDDDDEESASLAEIKEKIDAAVEDIKIPINYNKVISRWEAMELWIDELDVTLSNENDIHQYTIETLAELTALSVEQFHKAGELLLVKQHRSTADEADSLVQLTTTLSALIGIAASKFSEHLNSMASNAGRKEEINTLITNTFLEAGNSSRYIQDAFQLLIPVLQVGAI